MFTFTLEQDNEQFVKMKANITFNGIIDKKSDQKGLALIFGDKKKNFQIWMNLSFCHVPTKNTPVSPDASFTLKEYHMPFLGYDLDSYGFESDDQEEIEKIQNLWSHQTGFIYAKMRVCVELKREAVKMVLAREEPKENSNETATQNRKMLVEEICTDLEIRCGGGEIVKCHRAMLGVRSAVFKAMFQAEGMEEAKTGKLRMEEMSEQGVRALLGWVFWNDEEEALLEVDVAVQLLIAGDKYGMEGLVEKMKEIILERRGYDEEWFSVEAAVELYGWARKLRGKFLFFELERKVGVVVVGVLKFFGKWSPKKLVGSEDYQKLIKTDAKAAKELTQNN